jgi:phage baseplate assembly protein W
VQLCAKTILTTSGQDYLRPEYGGNILSLSGRSLNSDDIPRLKADIAYIIKSSEEQILREQVDKVIPADDRLRKITLLSIDIDLSEGTVDIRVLVENESGRASKFNFEASVRV